MLGIIVFHFLVRTMVHVMDKIVTRIVWHGMFTGHLYISVFLHLIDFRFITLHISYILMRVGLKKYGLCTSLSWVRLFHDLRYSIGS